MLGERELHHAGTKENRLVPPSNQHAQLPGLLRHTVGRLWFLVQDLWRQNATTELLRGLHKQTLHRTLLVGADSHAWEQVYYELHTIWSRLSSCENTHRTALGRDGGSHLIQYRRRTVLWYSAIAIAAMGAGYAADLLAGPIPIWARSFTNLLRIPLTYARLMWLEVPAVVGAIVFGGLVGSLAPRALATGPLAVAAFAYGAGGLLPYALGLLPNGMCPVPHQYGVSVIIGLISSVAASVAFARRRIAPGCCEVCGYNLHGNISGICPECGTPLCKQQIRP